MMFVQLSFMHRILIFWQSPLTWKFKFMVYFYFSIHALQIYHKTPCDCCKKVFRPLWQAYHTHGLRRSSITSCSWSSFGAHRILRLLTSSLTDCCLSWSSDSAARPTLAATSSPPVISSSSYVPQLPVTSLKGSFCRILKVELVCSSNSSNPGTGVHWCICRVFWREKTGKNLRSQI